MFVDVYWQENASSLELVLAQPVKYFCEQKKTGIFGPEFYIPFSQNSFSPFCDNTSVQPFHAEKSLR